MPRAQARQRPQTGRKLKMTRSPAARPVTPAPTSSMTPAPSCPPMMGSGQGRSPVSTCSSEWHRPLPPMATRTSPSFGGSSSISSTDKSLFRSHSTAARVFISFLHVADGIVVSTGEAFSHPQKALGVAVGNGGPLALGYGRHGEEVRGDRRSNLFHHRALTLRIMNHTFVVCQRSHGTGPARSRDERSARRGQRSGG